MGNKNKLFTLKELIIILIIGFIASHILTEYIAVKAYIPSGSMENTLMVNDSILISKVTYKITGIRRGDIMVFNLPDKDEYLIKRAIGLPGETIEGKDGYIYINNKKIEEPYTKNLLDEDFGPYTIPDNEYFMMGDNRTDSFDSRYWDYKFVNINNIIGRAYFRYRGGFKVIKGYNYT